MTKKGFLFPHGVVVAVYTTNFKVVGAHGKKN